MISGQDLIEQAEHLLNRNSRKPKQVDLRRSVSACYYAIFHSLTQDSAKLIVSGNRTKLRARLLRGYPHARIRKVCTAVANGNKPKGLMDETDQPLSNELKRLSDFVVMLQEERHTADYDHQRQFLKADEETILEDAKAAMNLIQHLRADDELEYAFLISLFAEC